MSKRIIMPILLLSHWVYISLILPISNSVGGGRRGWRFSKIHLVIGPAQRCQISIISSFISLIRNFYIVKYEFKLLNIEFSYLEDVAIVQFKFIYTLIRPYIRPALPTHRKNQNEFHAKLRYSLKYASHIITNGKLGWSKILRSSQPKPFGINSLAWTIFHLIFCNFVLKQRETVNGRHRKKYAGIFAPFQYF